MLAQCGGEGFLFSPARHAAGELNPDAFLLIEAGALGRDSALRKVAEKAPAVATIPCYEDEPGDVARQVREALGKLRSAKLLGGVRGAPPVDTDAIVKVVLAIGRLMRSVPEIVEIDVNPLMVHAKGQGVTALDALIVTDA